MMENTPISKDFIFYRSEDGLQSVKVLVEEESIWLSQKQMAELFKTDISGISRHLKNIFETQELDADSVIAKFAITANDGKSYKVDHYNLDAIIAVGYRVNSYKATKFRQWATRTLKEYLIKGFAMDDERLKQGKTLFGKDYFDELLARIAEIRASEARFYEKVRDLFAISYDYDGQDRETWKFFASVQNKLEYAVTGYTAAELISQRANAQLPNMGLSTWKGQKQGEKIVSSDITIAKNYLYEEEIQNLNRLVSMFLDYAQNLVEQKSKKAMPLMMDDWKNNVDRFLEFNDYDVLKGLGNRNKKTADKMAKKQFEAYRVEQDQKFIENRRTEEENTFDSIRITGILPKEKDK